MNQNLFETFNPVSSKQWKHQIQFELKGADYNETLVWESPEGIKVKPFYHNDEHKADFFISNTKSKAKICQSIYVHDVEKSIKRANKSVQKGAESIRFTIPNHEIKIVDLLQSIHEKKVPIYLNLNFLNFEFCKEILDFANAEARQIYIHNDPIGNLTKEGNWFSTPDKDNFTTLRKIQTASGSTSFLSVDGTLYQNAGANIVQQLAYCLSHVNEYFNSLDKAVQPIVFQLAVGSNYFFEIAKIRALRLLFKLLAKEFDANENCHIWVTPTKRNKTIYDYNVNMLRTTTECMSAILGNADAVSNFLYDGLYHKENEFADRIARNQLLILKKESYLSEVENPADGAYYIESLTQQLAEKALELFKDIESKGGFLKQLQEGVIQKKIQESAEKEQLLFDSGKEVLLGTNKYPNPNDKMKSDLELFPFVKIKPRKTLIVPIVEKRLAEKIEQERLAQE